MAADAAVPFLRALGPGLLREQPPEAAAAAAHAALQAVWAGQRTLVLDVQFTGFAAKGQLVGGVHPATLRAAGALIMHRVSRIGFTPEAAVGDLTELLRIATRSPAELAGEGIIDALRASAPRGVYVSTAAGAYRPPALAPAAEPEAEAQPAAAAPAPAPVAAVQLTEEEEADLSSFELVDEVEELKQTSVAAAPASGAARPPRGEDDGAGMFAFFRASGPERVDTDADALPGLLRAATDMSEYERLAGECARTAVRGLRGDLQSQGLRLMEALAHETERADRTRLFREAAEQALRRSVTGDVLPLLVNLLQHPGEDRDRALHVLAFLGGDAIPALENALFRSADGEVRRAIFRRLLKTEGGGRHTVQRSLQEPAPRLRLLLELVTLPELDADFAQRWLADAAQHGDPVVRADVAKHAAALGGRPGLRVLLDLLTDADKTVVRAALLGLATLGDPAAVPFLARLLNDNTDDALQLGAIAALGRTGSPDALPPLMALVNRRQLISTQRVRRLKTAAVEAIGRTRAPSARDILEGISRGSDSELAAEAKRALLLLD